MTDFILNECDEYFGSVFWKSCNSSNILCKVELLTLFGTSVFYIKYLKEEQNTRDTYDFEKVLGFAFCRKKQNTSIVLCKIKKYFPYLLHHNIEVALLPRIYVCYL
jgi:hypothetical protein